MQVDAGSNLPVVASPSAILGRKSLKVENPLVEQWLNFTKKHSGLKSAQSERTYRNAVKQLFGWFNDNGKNIFTATDDDVYSWLEHLKTEKSPSTVQLYLVAARLFFAFLHKQRIIAENPCDGMKAGVKTNREHKRDYTTLIYSHALEREKNDTEIAIGRLIFNQ